MEQYTVVRHPRTGGLYAVEAQEGRVVAAAGPLPDGHPTDADSVHWYIVQHPADLADDAEWLQQALNRAA